MLPINFIRTEKQRVLRSLKLRHFEDTSILDKIIQLDDKRKTLQRQLDENLSESNKISKEIGALYKNGKREEAEKLKGRSTDLRTLNEAIRHGLTQVLADLDDLQVQIPNCAHESVPEGKSDEDNEVFQEWSKELPVLDDGALPHWELMEKYGLVDQKIGAKITGAGFMLYKGMGAKLQRGLINFFLDEAEKAGYQEFIPPHLVNEASARGTGQLPDKEGQMYYIKEDDLYLIPTAEVPLMNIFRDVVLNEEDFPIRVVGFTPSFRREAGSYGAHVRGLNRLHQFDKVEIVQVAHPDNSYTMHQEMCNHVEGLLQKLELPYRILRLCGGDIGFSAALTFDFETYSAAQKRWLEVSSVSNCETFQTNRLKLRFRPKEGKGNRFAHSLNGSALALPRILATILENNQTAEGIRVPKALQPYVNAEIIKL